MIKKILFITLSNIGDAIMTTPLLEFLYKKYPDAIFDLICDRRSVEIFKYSPRINKIFLKEKNWGISGNLKFVKSLRNYKYDIAIDLRTDFLLFFIRADQKFSKINNKHLHSCVKHFGALGINPIPKLEPKIYIPLKVKDKLKKVLPLNTKRIISVGLGSNDIEKIWPVDRYLKLITLLKEKFDLIVLVGDKNDKNSADYFTKLANFNTLNLCGKLSLIETSSVIENSIFFIGNDSGLGHIASAVETSSFTIFGKGNPKIYKPYGHKGFYFQSPKKNIKDIKVETIYKALKKILINDEKEN